MAPDDSKKPCARQCTVKQMRTQSTKWNSCRKFIQRDSRIQKHEELVQPGKDKESKWEGVGEFWSTCPSKNIHKARDKFLCVFPERGTHASPPGMLPTASLGWLHWKGWAGVGQPVGKLEPTAGRERKGRGKRSSCSPGYHSTDRTVSPAFGYNTSWT